MKLDRPLYLTADRNSVVEEGDPAAAFLLAAAGHEVPDAEAERLGLKPSKKQAATDPAPEPEAKEQAAPANKARKAAKSK